jgi:regulator of nucleoside diphosphate kinase
MQSQVSSDSRPTIYVTADEYDALSALALSAEHRHPRSAAMLLAELDRAELCDAADLPPQTVRMNSSVEFVDEESGVRRTVQLVYPHDADIEAGRISILTPIGAGLIGMSAGNAISWPDRKGHVRSLKIVSVIPPDRD